MSHKKKKNKQPASDSPAKDLAGKDERMPRKKEGDPEVVNEPSSPVCYQNSPEVQEDYRWEEE